MNISYFMSVLDLYLSKEKEHKTNLTIIKYHAEKIKVNFTMNHDLNEKTSFFVGYDNFMENDNFCQFLESYKRNMIVIDEKYEYDKLSEVCFYSITLSNGRILSFNNFSLNEVNKIRNLVHNINFRPEEIKIKLDDEEKYGYYKPNVLLGQVGFVSFLTFFVIIIAIVNIFIIALWIFKNFI